MLANLLVGSSGSAAQTFDRLASTKLGAQASARDQVPLGHALMLVVHGPVNDPQPGWFRYFPVKQQLVFLSMDLSDPHDSSAAEYSIRNIPTELFRRTEYVYAVIKGELARKGIGHNLFFPSQFILNGRTMAGSEPAQKARLGKADETEERRLVEAAQQDRACFGDVYERYFELIYGYVARRVRDRAASEDLTSEVFRKALANIDRFKWTGAPFGAWLLRIASNVIADRLKRQARDGVRVDKPAATVGLTAQDVASPSQSQQLQLEDAERRAWVIRKVDELPEDQRRVVRMRFADERSISEIAAALGRSEGAIKQLQFRALQNLRIKLTTEDTEEERPRR